MKRTARIGLALAVTMILGLVSVAAATAGARPFKVHYKGMTSADGKLSLTVSKNDQGKRRVSIGVHLETVCEDGTAGTGPDGVGVFEVKVAEDGTFHYHFQTQPGTFFDNRWMDVTGDIGFRLAEGTFEFRFASLNADGEAQLCSTGPLTWTAERQSQGGGTRMPIGDDFLTFR